MQAKMETLISPVIYVMNIIASTPDCILSIPDQLICFLVWYIIWYLLPVNVKGIIRDNIIMTLAHATYTLYKLLKTPLKKTQERVEEYLGQHGKELIESFISRFSGYHSVKDMIYHKAYTYINLGDKIDKLGDYIVVDVNGLSKFVEKPNDSSNRQFRDHFVIYTNGRGIKYDVTPCNKFPNDLPDGHYELLRLIGSKYESVGIFSNPNEITISKRRDY